MPFAGNTPFPITFQATFTALQASAVASTVGESSTFFIVPTGYNFKPAIIIAQLTDDVSATGKITFTVREKGVGDVLGTPSVDVVAGDKAQAGAFGTGPVFEDTELVVSALPSSDWTVGSAANATITICGYLQAN